MNNRVDIVVDIETLGNKTDSTIIQLSAIIFDILTGNIIKEFNEYVDISKVENINVTGDTLKWWLKTDKNLLEAILIKGNKSELDVVSNFLSFINSSDTDISKIYLWGNGILFDNKMIQALCDKYKLKYPIYYRNDRDMRTLVELYCMKNEIDNVDFISKFKDCNLVEHNSIDDCKKQIKIISTCFNDLIYKGDE